MVRLWNSRVERVVKGAVRGGIVGEPERRVAWVEGERVFGLGRWAEGGMEMIREVVEHRPTNIATSDIRGSNML